MYTVCLQEGVDLFTLEQPGAEPTLAEPTVQSAFCQTLWGSSTKKARLWLQDTRSTWNSKTNQATLMDLVDKF